MFNMEYKLILGRNNSDKEKFGDEGLIYIGKQYVKMGETTSLSNKVLLDVARSHVILLSGKRGSGKSYSLGVIAEEISSLDEEISKNLAVVIFDTMGIFWTMKFPNLKDERLLLDWNLKPKPSDKIELYVPSSFAKKYSEEGIEVDHSFSIKTSELDPGDWINSFGLDYSNPVSVVIEKAISGLKGKNYSIKDIIKSIEKEREISKEVRLAAINRFISAESWGLFSQKGTKIEELIKGGKVSVLDLSVYSHMAGNWGIKNLVVGLISKKLLMERILSRKIEEKESIEYGKSYLGLDDTIEDKDKKPLVWLMIDEAHEFLPREGKTAATDSLVQLLREGRQPGISMVLATQQPGEIHKDVITQSDLVISHRVTARKDVTALNDIMQTYLYGDIQKYLNNLPREKGSAIILDDNSERIYPVKIRPKVTWHGGEAPSAVKAKRKELLELGL